MIHVSTVSIEATVDGQRLGVQEAVITLGVNAIPQVELSCAPTSSSASASSSPHVSKPVISEFMQMYSSLAKKAENMDVVGNVTISVKGESGTDEVELKNWVLCGVGMSEVGAVSAPYLSVIMRHPICRLTQVGSVYETPSSVSNILDNSGIRNAKGFISIVKAVYEAVQEDANWRPAPPNYSSAIQELRHALSGLNIGDYLVDKTESAPFLGLEGYARQRMNLSQAEFVLPREGGASTWDMLTGVSGTFLTSITQDQDNNYTTGSLVFGPMSPWSSKGEIVLDDSTCSSIELPGMDPFRIVGVSAKKPSVVGHPYHSGAVKFGNPKNNNTGVGDVLWVPPGLQPKKSYGRIMRANVPEALTNLIYHDAAYGKSIVKASTDCTDAYVAGYDDLLERYCQAVFQCTVKSMSSASIVRPLGFRDALGSGGGSLILPGLPCKLISGGKDLFYGYIRSVVHTAAIKGGCSTAIALSHARSTKDLMINDQSAIGYGTENAAYAKKG